MKIVIRKFERGDIPEAAAIWNSVVRDAAAFPQDTELDELEAGDFFAGQSFTGVAEDTDTGKVLD